MAPPKPAADESELNSGPVFISEHELDALCDALPTSAPTPACMLDVYEAITTHFPLHLALLNAVATIRRNEAHFAAPASWEENMSGSYRVFLWFDACVCRILEFEQLRALFPGLRVELKGIAEKARTIAGLDRPLWDGKWAVEIYSDRVPKLVERIERVLRMAETVLRAEKIYGEGKG